MNLNRADSRRGVLWLAVGVSLLVGFGAGHLLLTRSAGPTAVFSPGRRATPGSGNTLPPAATPARQAAPPLFDNVTTAESSAISRFLATQPGLRAARDSDQLISDDTAQIARLYGVYHPYFVRGDLSDDGTMDFATAFVSQAAAGTTTWFTVAVFRGDRHGGYLPPVFVEREASLESGDLSIDRDTLVVTPDLSQDQTRRYRWNPVRGEFVAVTSAGAEIPSEDSNSSTRI